MMKGNASKPAPKLLTSLMNDKRECLLYCDISNWIYLFVSAEPANQRDDLSGIIQSHFQDF